MHAVTDLSSFGVVTSLELITCAVLRVLLTQEQLCHSQSELNVPAQTTTSLAIVMQCACLNGRLKMVPLCLTGLFKATTGDGCRKCGSR
jgi:hypothetical protein